MGQPQAILGSFYQFPNSLSHLQGSVSFLVLWYYSQLLHHTHRVVGVPGFHDLRAVGDPLNGGAPNRDPIDSRMDNPCLSKSNAIGRN